MISVLAVLAGCGDRRAPTVAPKAPDASTRAPESVHATTASRCEECHGKISASWRSSTHANARSPRYQAMVTAGADQKACVRCHEPLVGRVAADEPVAEEAVTCDVCHLVASVKPSRTGAPLAISTDGDLKLGPLCDLKDHYFHKVGCSPLHAESTFCGGCHLYYTTSSAGPIPVYTEYEEWQTSEHGQSGLACQSCHMPSEREEVARGTGAARTVHQHGFAWRDTLRGKALELDVKREADAVAINVRNTGAGHRVPSGAPEHRLVVRARALDSAGAALGTDEHVLGRVLVDASGAEVPFYRAVKQKEDTRIAPGEAYATRWTVPDGTTAVEVEVLWRDVPAALAGTLGAPPVELRMAERRLPWSRGKSR